MKTTRVCAALSLTLVFTAQAQTAAVVVPPGAAPNATATVPMTEGEVRKVDKDQGKLTLRHGPIANLDMSAMTMVFRVADPRMLGALKEGDKVRFAAEKVNGAFTVTAIETAE